MYVNLEAFRQHTARKAGTVEIMSEPREARDFDGKGHPDEGVVGLKFLSACPQATSC